MAKLTAVTVEYCEVEGYICHMCEYNIDPMGDIEEQCKFCARLDYASVVEVYEEGKEEPIHTFVFDEFKCKCTKESH